MRYFYLTPMLGGPGAARYPITEKVQMIGRSERSEISLVEPTVSRQHATIECDGGRVVLKDLGSKHGTFVNSRRVQSANLKVGDIVVFGLTLVLRLEASDQPMPVVQNRASSLPDFIGDDLAVTAIRTVTIPPPGRPTAPGESHEDIGRIQNQMAKVHKLAAAGAACVQQLPELAAKLGNVRTELAARAGARSGLERALSMIDEVLVSLQRLTHNLSLLPRRRLEATALAEVVEQALAMTASEAAQREIKVVTQVPGDLMVPAEVHRLAHALTELLRNAIRHSGDGAMVQISAGRTSDGVSLAVIDSGPGFPPEILESACDPFVTRSGEWEALGLGLFEARQIVMSCGGILQIESRHGFGATVRMLLPAAS